MKGKNRNNKNKLTNNNDSMTKSFNFIWGKIGCVAPAIELPQFPYIRAHAQEKPS
jgi:hypothetical protein